MQKKKILIASYSAGSGHVSAAKGLETYLNKFPGKYITEHVNLNDHLSLIMRILHINLYNFMVQKIPEFYGNMYETLDNPKRTSRFMSIFWLIKRISTSKFLKYLRSVNPDLVICTHYLSAEITRNISRRFQFQLPIFLVITDYGFHNFWGVEHLQHYFVPTSKMKDILEEQYKLRGKVTTSGIPINPVFHEEKENEMLRNKHEIHREEKVVLVLSGGEGHSRSDRIVENLIKLEEKFTIITIAGKNKKLLNKLKNLTPPPYIRIIPIGWTDVIDEYMRIADIIITKSGGLATSESLALGKHILITPPVRGQETINAEFMLEHGYGHIVHNMHDFVFFIIKQLHSPEGRYKYAATPGAEIIREKIDEFFLKRDTDITDEKVSNAVYGMACKSHTGER